MKKLGVSPEENSAGLGLAPDPAAVLQDDPGPAACSTAVLCLQQPSLLVAGNFIFRKINDFQLTIQCTAAAVIADDVNLTCKAGFSSQHRQRIFGWENSAGLPVVAAKLCLGSMDHSSLNSCCKL